MIYNLQRTTPQNNTKSQQMAVDMKPVMNIFLSQLKLLLGMMPVVRIKQCLHDGITGTTAVRLRYDCGTAAVQLRYDCGSTAVLLWTSKYLRLRHNFGKTVID